MNLSEFKLILEVVMRQASVASKTNPELIASFATGLSTCLNKLYHTMHQNAHDDMAIGPSMPFRR